MGSATRISNYAAQGVAQLISMYSKPRGATVALLPVVLSITPNAGTLGTLVRIQGYNFENVSAVTIGGAACTGVIVGGGVITCFAPAGVSGAQDVVVTGPAGSATLAAAFTYPAVGVVPTVASVSTAGGAVGDIDGNYPATVTGTGFIIGATSFTFGGTAATGVVVSSSTTATMTVPAHATGTVSVVATTSGGSSPANSAFRYFSPAERACNGWVRAPYVSPSMAGVASAGTSSSGGAGQGLAQDADLDAVPTAGTTQNGFAPANFSSQGLETGNNASSFVTAAAGTFVALIYVPSAAATTGVFNDPAIFTDRGTNLIASFSTSGAQVGIFDGTSQKTRTLACPAGSYHLIAFRWDSANLDLRVDSTDATPIACGAIASLANRIVFGKNPGVAFLNFRMLEWTAEPTKASAAALLDYKSYYNTRYNLTM